MFSAANTAEIHYPAAASLEWASATYWLLRRAALAHADCFGTYGDKSLSGPSLEDGRMGFKTHTIFVALGLTFKRVAETRSRVTGYPI